MKQYIASDVAKRTSHMVATTARGKVLHSRRIPNRPDAVADFFAALPPGRRVATLEACRDWAMVHDLIAPHVDEIQLAHPKKVRAIAEARIKNDRIDAETLAHLLRAGLIPQAHIRAPQARERQQLLRQYTFMVALRRRVKQNIHVLVDRQAWPVRQQAAALRSLFTRAGRRWLTSVPLPATQRLLLDALLSALEHFDQQVRVHRRWIHHEMAGDPTVELLRSLPGIGLHWGTVVTVEIDGIDRFPNRQRFAAYSGLVPATRASAEVVHHGSIIRESNPWLRTAFIEAAWVAIRCDPQLRATYERLKTKKGKPKAIVAVARKLAERCWVVLHEQRPYEIRPVGSPRRCA